MEPQIPLLLIPVRKQKLSEQNVRLACVKHIASVPSELSQQGSLELEIFISSKRCFSTNTDDLSAALLEEECH
jgi:hypothetical protein